MYMISNASNIPTAINCNYIKTLKTFFGKSYC